MSDTDFGRGDNARKKADEKSRQQESAFFKERKRIATVNAEKTSRLRALRLAHEAVLAEAAAKELAENPPPLKKVRVRKPAVAKVVEPAA